MLCKHEVVGSIPSASTNNSLRSKERQQAWALDRRQRFARQNVRAGASGYSSLIQEKKRDTARAVSEGSGLCVLIDIVKRK